MTHYIYLSTKALNKSGPWNALIDLTSLFFGNLILIELSSTKTHLISYLFILQTAFFFMFVCDQWTKTGTIFWWSLKTNPNLNTRFTAAQLQVTKCLFSFTFFNLFQVTNTHDIYKHSVFVFFQLLNDVTTSHLHTVSPLDDFVRPVGPFHEWNLKLEVLDREKKKWNCAKKHIIYQPGFYDPGRRWEDWVQFVSKWGNVGQI